MVYKYNFQERLNKFIKFDKIRFYKILEMIQYTTLFYITIIILIIIVNKYFSNIFDVDKKIEDIKKNENLTDNEIKYSTFCILFFYILVYTIIIIILFFYIRKFILIFPSLPNTYDKSFIPHTTFDFVNKIALVYLTMSLLAGYSENLTKLKNIITNL